jgi:energy-coupling factor transporter transmembrane protein EcfT
MDRKNLPLLLMLVTGIVTCVITFIEKYTMIAKLVSLFVVLLLFYVLGSVLKWTLDFFDRQNEEKLKEEGEVIEKEPDEFAESQPISEQ